MNFALTPLFAAWVALACAVAGLAIYRRLIAGHEDDMLHMRDSEAARIPVQVAIASRLEIIDRWGKILTVFAVVCGVLLAVAYLYQVWMEGFRQM